MTDASLSLDPVVIVGGHGGMGQFLSSLFRDRGIVCSAIDIETTAEERRTLLKSAGTVIISVPISRTISVIREILPQIPPDSLLADITSIKKEPLQAMLGHTGEVLGLHPMCGPSVNSLTGQIVVACPGRPGPRGGRLMRFFEDCGAKTIELGADRHDQLMAVVQGLNHFQSITFAHALGKLDIPVEDTLSVASPIYLLRIQLMGRILAQSAKLYSDIELHNPYVRETLETLEKSTGEFLQIIRDGDEEGCIRFFEEAATAFGSWKDTALKESDTLLDTLRSRKS